MNQAVDMTDKAATKRSGQALGLVAKGQAAIAFVEPELLGIGRETLARWIEHEPRLADLAHYTDDLFRKRHLRDMVERAVEQLPEHHRVVFVLREMEGKSYEDTWWEKWPE